MNSGGELLVGQGADLLSGYVPQPKTEVNAFTNLDGDIGFVVEWVGVDAC